MTEATTFHLASVSAATAVMARLHFVVAGLAHAGARSGTPPASATVTVQA